MANDPKPTDVGTQILSESTQTDDTRLFLQRVLSLVIQHLHAQQAVVAAARRGAWTVLGLPGETPPLPTDLLADVLDAAQPQSRDRLLAVPLDEAAQYGEVLVLYFAAPPGTAATDTAITLARVLATGMENVRERSRRSRRIERLEAILEIAGQWNQTHEMEPLLEQMAETSTRLLHAERASIFLWDKANHTLVGRPALGVENGELRIPDDRGVVGQVVQSGQPQRVDADTHSEQKMIDRHVDQQLGYTTNTLLCVPLRGRSGQLFGAFEMINKIGGNFNGEDEAALVELAGHAAIALENTQQYEQLVRARRQMAEAAAERVQLVGESPAIEALRSAVQRVADTDLAVLILGENGSGKEVVAQLIHYLSKRRDEPFVAVNCAALTETLLESELFGHEKGAFTDAHETRQGKFELASGGTLFLDEIGDFSRAGQAKLLRVLEEKVVVRVGGSTPIHTDARVVAATNQELAELVRERRFREDLFFRLNVVTLDLPPLRERGDDVLLLADYFLAQFSHAAGRPSLRLTAAARKRLRAHSWPGNVRELRNLMERLAYLSAGDKIDASDIAFILAPQDSASNLASLDLPLTEATSRFQIEYIRRHIRRARGNMSDAARNLGLHRSNLYRKMRQLDMSSDEPHGDE